MKEGAEGNGTGRDRQNEGRLKIKKKNNEKCERQEKGRDEKEVQQMKDGREEVGE